MTGGVLLIFLAGWCSHWLWQHRYDLSDWLDGPDPLPHEREPLPAMRSVRIVRRDEGE